MDHLALLRMWCETTVQAIFPQRKAGFLKEGYEVNFIVSTEIRSRILRMLGHNIAGGRTDKIGAAAK